MINCAGAVIKKISEKFGIEVPMPDFVYQRYCTLKQLQDFLSSMGLVVLFSGCGQSFSFHFKDLSKHNIVMLISYEGINGDDSKHVEIVQAMDKDNRIKLPHINRWLELGDFDVVCFTFVSDKDMTGIIDVS
jgi:hypothetical protein